MKRADLWLSYAWNESFGAYLAIASTKHPDLGDTEVDVVAHSVQASKQGCFDWFDSLRREKGYGDGAGNARSSEGDGSRRPDVHDP